MPLQSLSKPSHTSSVGPVAPVQLPNTPLVQVWIPDTHSPMSVPHESLIPSSTVPSQSLSRLSHVSALGLPGVHVSTPPAQTPLLWQAPVPHVLPVGVPSATGAFTQEAENSSHASFVQTLLSSQESGVPA